MMTRVLFVDDEPKVLAAIQRMLRSQRNQWEMAFAEGGQAALDKFAEAPFDVIVTDMRMPGMDGAALLKIVQERYPNSVRIVLSGYADLEASLRAVCVSHQFLNKPCDAELLRGAVARASDLRTLLRQEKIRGFVNTIGTLPSLPRTYAALMSALANPDASMEAIAKIVEGDVAMNLKVLQIVNSAFFALPRRVTSVENAVSLLGINMLKNLVLSVEIFRSFDGPEGVAGFSLEGFQRHSSLVAGIAKRLLKDQSQADDAFTAGMMHETGKLIGATKLPDRFHRVRALMRETGRPMFRVEEELDGTTHAEVGAYLLSLWGLPYPIVEAVANHHSPTRVSHSKLDVLGAVYVANILAHENGVPPPGEEVYEPLDTKYLESLGVTAELPAWRAMAAELASTVQPSAQGN